MAASSLLPARAVHHVACGLVCLITLVATAPPAAAQKDDFVEALIAFRMSLAGTYGDEGAQVLAHLDRMASSLAQWDRTLAAIEGDMHGALPAASIETALRIHTTLASLYIERGRLADALAALDAAITLAPSRSGLHLLRGLVREAAGARVEAVADLRQAWTLDPEHPTKAYLLADRGVAHGLIDDPGPQLEVLLAAHAAAGGPAPDSVIELALIHDAAADWPVFSPARYVDGFALVSAGRYTEALARFREAAAGDPLVAAGTSDTEHVARGIAALRTERFASAVEYLEEAARARPDASEAWRLLGTAYGADGRHDEASVRFAAAVRLAPGDERARLALARSLMREDRRDDAERALQQTIEVVPASAEARWLLADLYDTLGRRLDAIGALQAVTGFPLLAGRSQLYWRLADLLHQHQDYDAAAQVLATRARLLPNSATAHKVLGMIHMRRGMPEEALLELLMASLLDPADADTLATIGQIHLEAERYDAAETVLRRAVAHKPDLAQARFALGTVLVRLGRTAEGQEQLAAFQRLRSAQLEEQRRTFELDTLRRDADLHAEAGRLDAAAEVWAQVIALEPDQPAHRAALASVLTAAGQLEAAVRHLETAIAMEPDAVLYRQLAALYARLGRAEESARASAAAERLRREGSPPLP